MKRSVCDRLVHTICVLFCGELTLDDDARADNLADLNPERASLIYSICNGTGGSVAQCKFNRCTISFHPYCAFKNNNLLLMRHCCANENNNDTDDAFDFDYEMYCDNHQAYVNNKNVVSSTLSLTKLFHNPQSVELVVAVQS